MASHTTLLDLFLYVMFHSIDSLDILMCVNKTKNGEHIEMCVVDKLTSDALFPMTCWKTITPHWQQLLCE